MLPLPAMYRPTAGLLLINLSVLSSPSLLGMLLLIGLERILHFGLLVGFNFLIVLVLLRPKRFVIFGMFTFGKLALFLLLFVSSFSVFATLLMLIRLGFFGVGKLRLVLLVLIFLLVALPSRVPVVMLVEALSLCLFYEVGW